MIRIWKIKILIEKFSLKEMPQKANQRNKNHRTRASLKRLNNHKQK